MLANYNRQNERNTTMSESSEMGTPQQWLNAYRTNDIPLIRLIGEIQREAFHAGKMSGLAEACDVVKDYKTPNQKHDDE